MATNVYEGLFILDSNSYNRDPAKVSGQIANFVEKMNGEMLVSRLWEERRLAYPIKGQRKGAYWLTYFRLDGSQLAAINRNFQLSDTILRSLVLKIDPRIADTLIQHATEPAQKETAADSATKAAARATKSAASDENGAGQPETAPAEAVADDS